jgi:transcriptional regulator with XRE-family HTH domain
MLSRDQALFLTVADFFKQSAPTISVVRKRSGIHPEIGRLFRQLREDKGWGLRQAARLAGARSLTLLTMNSLGFLERGATKNPDPELLKEVATLYGVPYEKVAGEYVRVRYWIERVRYGIDSAGTDLIRQTGDQGSDLSKGERSDVPAQPAPSRVQHEYDTLLTAAVDVAFHLSKMLAERGVDVAAVAHDAATGTGKRPIRKRPRKAS